MKTDYNIYAGLDGSFGGAVYQGTLINSDLFEAEDCAYRMAVEEYESYEGLHGIKDWMECFEDFCEEKGIEPTDENQAEYSEEIDNIYLQEIDDWISYYAIEKDKDEDFDESEYHELN